MHLSFTVLRMRRNGSRCCWCRRSGALPPVCRLLFSEKIPQGPSVADPENNPTLFRRGGEGQFRVPRIRPRRQEIETRFEGNFFSATLTAAPSSSFCGRRAARATSAAGRRRCCCCSQRRAPLFSLFLRTVVVAVFSFLPLNFSAQPSFLIPQSGRNRNANFSHSHAPRRNREFRTRGAQPWATRANGNGTCRRPGREEPEHFHFSFPLCHPSLVVDNFPVTLSRGAVPQKKILFHRRDGRNRHFRRCCPLLLSVPTNPTCCDRHHTI